MMNMAMKGFCNKIYDLNLIFILESYYAFNMNFYKANYFYAIENYSVTFFIKKVPSCCLYFLCRNFDDSYGY